MIGSDGFVTKVRICVAFVGSDTRTCPCPYHLIPPCLIFSNWKQHSNSPLLCRCMAEQSDSAVRRSMTEMVTFVISLTGALENKEFIFKQQTCCCSHLTAISKEPHLLSIEEKQPMEEKTLQKAEIVRHMFLKATSSITAFCLQSGKSHQL